MLFYIPVRNKRQIFRRKYFGDIKNFSGRLPLSFKVICELNVWNSLKIKQLTITTLCPNCDCLTMFYPIWKLFMGLRYLMRLLAFLYNWVLSAGQHFYRCEEQGRGEEKCVNSWNTKFGKIYYFLIVISHFSFMPFLVDMRKLHMTSQSTNVWDSTNTNVQLYVM